MELNNKHYTALRVSHAKSLQDIAELKKLRESVGKNILQACILVDGHERDLSEHCENLRKTRESFSKFERRLSNATLSSVEGSVYGGRRYYNDSLNSCSSGDDSSSVRSRRSTRPSSIILNPRSIASDDDHIRSRRRYSYCSTSDGQSVSSPYRCSPRNGENGRLKQIVVPIYEDSFDSGVSVQTTSPRTTVSGSIHSDANGLQSGNIKEKHSTQKVHRSRGSAYDSDASSSVVSHPCSAADVDRQRRQSLQPKFVLSHTWRSTPNLLEDANLKCPRRRKQSLLDAKGLASKSKSSEWKSLPELGSRSEKENQASGKRTRKRKGIVHLFRRITKSGEYVLKSESSEKTKSKIKRQINDMISCPTSASPLGKTIQVVQDGKNTLHRVEIKIPSNGLYGFYIQKGFRKSKKGVYIGSFVNQQMKKLFAGIIREGDELIEINSLKVEGNSFDDALAIFNDTKLLNLLIFPYVNRKK